MSKTFEYVGAASSTASPEKVWAVLSDPSTWGDWWKQWDGASGDTPLQVGQFVKVSKVDLTPENPRRGSSTLGNRRQAGREIDQFPMEIVELEPQRRLAVLNDTIGEERFVFTITSSGQGSQIEYRRVAKVPRLLGLLGRAMRGRLEKEAEESASTLAALAAAG